MSADERNTQSKNRPFLRILFWAVSLLALTSPLWLLFTYGYFLQYHYQNAKSEWDASAEHPRMLAQRIAPFLDGTETGTQSTKLCLSWQHVFKIAGLSPPYIANGEQKETLIVCLLELQCFSGQKRKRQEALVLLFQLLALYQHQLFHKKPGTCRQCFNLESLVGNSGPCEHGKECKSCTPTKWDINEIKFVVNKDALDDVSRLLKELIQHMPRLVIAIKNTDHWKKKLKNSNKVFIDWTPKSLYWLNPFVLKDK